ncbi:hypothetical protein J6590_061122 [Homalodisca vitripennis]|nr:hypothetical protein J6590_061122 [Homalodisca vitripennis]
MGRINGSQRNLRRSKYFSSHAQEGPPPVVGSGTSISPSLFYQLCGSVSLAPFRLHCSCLPILYTYPGNLRFGVRLVAKWQWTGQGIEQAGECRAVVGILEEGGTTAAEGYLPHPA